MKKSKHVNKLIFLIVLVTVAFLSMGASSWLIISESSGNPLLGTPGEAPTLTLNAVEMYEGDTMPTSGFSATNAEGESVSGTFSVEKQPTFTPGVNTTCSTEATIKFVPEDTSVYKAVTGTVSITLRAVAKIGATYYGTIDSAIDNAKENETVLVYETFTNFAKFRHNHTLTGSTANATKESGYLLEYKSLPALTVRIQNQEIPANVTVTSPCDANGTVLDTTTSPTSSTDIYKTAKYAQYNFSIGSNITLINNGTIEIGGVVGSGSGNMTASVTAGNHGRVTIGANSTLTNNGVINCYGYLDEIGSTGSIVNNSGAQIKTLFTIIEHRGGSAYTNLVEMGWTQPYPFKTCPFNRFYMGNILPEMVVNYNVKLTGYVTLYMNSEPNPSELKISGPDTSYILQIPEGSKFVMNYDKSTNISRWDIYGNASLNQLETNLRLSLFSASVTTDGIFFPISWLYEYHLHPYENGNPSTMTLHQDIKIMPGGIMTVHEGVTLNATNLIVYDENFVSDSTKNCDPVKYVNNLADIRPAGELIVNGSMNVEYFGGKVSTENAGATLNITKQASTTSTEVTGSASDATLTPSWTQNATGNLYGIGNGLLSANTQYYSAEEKTGYYAWYNLGDKTITYNSNGGSAIASKTVSMSGSGISGHALTADDLPTPTKLYYTFEGWYTDIDLENRVDVGSVIYCDVTLYGNWTGKEYTINFVPNNEQDNYSETFTYSVDKGGSSLPDHGKVNGYDFSSWYADEELTIAVNSYNEALAQISGTDTSITLYGEWVGGYTVKFNINNGEYTGSISNINHGTIEEFTSSELPPPLLATDTMYFIGWYYGDIEFTDWSILDVDVSTYNVTAQWGKKYHLIINASNSGVTAGTAISIAAESVYLSPNELSTKFEELNTTAKAEDNNILTNKYFAGWTDANGNEITELTTDKFTDYKLTLTANWGDKAILNVKSSKTSSGYLGLGSQHSSITIMQSGATILSVNSNGTTSATAYILPGSTISYKYTFDTLTATETNWRGQTSATHYARLSVAGTVITNNLTTNSTYVDLVVSANLNIETYYT